MSYTTGPADESGRRAAEVESDRPAGVPADDAPPAADPAAAQPAATTAEPATAEPAAAPPATGRRGRRARDSGMNMLPEREHRRLGVERLLVRMIATAGIVGIGVAIGAIMVSSKVHGWIVGLVVAGVTVILSGLLWSSRQL